MRSIHRAWLAAALLALAANCSLTQRQEAEIAVADVLVSDKQEVELGAQIHQELEKQGVKLYKDPVVDAYVAGLLAQLAPHAKKDRNVDFHVHVVDDLKVTNAFATPGGHLYVYTGLLATADNESELVGVLAHELGHVTARHSARQLVTQYGLETVAGLALGKEPTELAQLAAQLVGQGTLLAHSRSDENEADTYAVRYAAAANYDPRGIAMFFRKLQTQEGKTPRVLTWLSTHPATPDRIEHVNQVIAREHLAGSKVGADTLSAIKQRLGQGVPVSCR